MITVTAVCRRQLASGIIVAEYEERDWGRGQVFSYGSYSAMRRIMRELEPRYFEIVPFAESWTRCQEMNLELCCCWPFEPAAPDGGRWLVHSPECVVHTILDRLQHVYFS